MAQENVSASVECILVNDCTPDGSWEIVCQMIASYNGPIKFELLRHDVNRGLSAARNTGILHAKGDYVFFIDSDDYLTPDSLSYFIDNLSQYPKADMVMGNVRNCKEDNYMIHNLDSPCYLDDRDVFFRRMLRHQIYLYAWNKLIKREILCNKEILFEDGILYEDQSWTYQLFSNISSLLILPRVTYVYEYNHNSIVNTTFTVENADKSVWSYTVSINKLLDTPPDPTLYTKKMTVDYLLFMANFLMNGVDVLSRFRISDDIAHDFLKVRFRLLSISLRNGRLLLACFFLLLFSPFCYFQKYRFFRHHYYDLESLVNRICHMTDFIHCK